MAANADNLMMSFFLDWQTNWAGQDPNYDFRSHIRHRRLVQSERAMRASLKNILIKQARDPGEDPVYVSALNR